MGRGRFGVYRGIGPLLRRCGFVVGEHGGREILTQKFTQLLQNGFRLGAEFLVPDDEVGFGVQLFRRIAHAPNEITPHPGGCVEVIRPEGGIRDVDGDVPPVPDDVDELCAGVHGFEVFHIKANTRRFFSPALFSVGFRIQPVKGGVHLRKGGLFHFIAYFRRARRNGPCADRRSSQGVFDHLGEIGFVR